MPSVVRCVLHGPSPAIVQDNDTRCERCSKRPVKTRIDKRDPVVRVSPVDIARLDKQRVQDKTQLLRRAYLQGIPLPDNKPKVPAVELTVKRSKQKEQLADIKRKREDRLRQVYRAYSLSIPFYYSPFVTRPKWLKQRQADTSEYQHNVQAVIQSLERRDNLRNLSDMRAKENKFYRTTRGAAWKVLYVRQPGNPPHFDAMYDQHAGNSYRKCLAMIHQAIGPKPKNTVPDNCHPTYSDSPRATGAQRHNPGNTYKAPKYRLQSYRYQRLHQYPINYMVKGILAMNQALCPSGVRKRKTSMLRHMRTTLKVRQLFHHHNQEFLQVFKRMMADHALNTDDPKVRRKWQNFLATKAPPRDISYLLAMTSAVSEQKAHEK